MLKDYSEFIYFLLHTENKEHNEVDNEIRHQSFFSDDAHFSSIFYKDGYMEIYNGYYPIEGVKRYTIKQVSKLLGYFDKYIAWICKEYNIPIHSINRLRELKSCFKLSESEDKELTSLIKKIYPIVKEEFISLQELVKVGELSKAKMIKPTTFLKKKKSKSEIIETNEKPPLSLINYFNYRQLKESEICYPVVIDLKSEHYITKLNAIAFKYETGFVKYRIHDGFTRFLCSGDFEELYWAYRNSNNNKLVILEGEAEAYILSQMFDMFDIAGLHNSSSFATKKDLTTYKEIIIMLDLDKFEESKKVLEKELDKYNLKARFMPKFNTEKDDNDNKIDINSEYIKNKENLKKYIDSIINM